jgi:exopolyphosphatase/guanosine-5'-triphosphate,3'-diphosphate pyrophosphatase
MSDEIIPRWEWRCFGTRFGAASDLVATLTPDRVDDSDEVYVLSRNGDALVKVRNDLMDVKRLETVENDLELWRPVLKKKFPLSADDVGTVRTALGITGRLRRWDGTFADFEREALRPDPDLRAVAVHKHRRHYVVDGCMVELTTLTVDDRSIDTLVLEATDPQPVVATIRRFGLEHRANVNVARGLKALVDFGTRRVTIIDVGTNSVKYVIVDAEGDTPHSVEDGGIVTRLGQGRADSGALSTEAMQRTADAIASIVQRAQTGSSVSIIAVGTAGLRQAPNTAAFLDIVQERAGIAVTVISGEEEARLAYRAAVATLPLTGDTFVVFDTGGGSSQFTIGRRQEIDEQFSLDIGAARITEQFGLDRPVSAEQVATARAAVGDEFAVLAQHRGRDALIGMGGTATNLTAVHLGLDEYDADRVHGTVLTVTEIDRQIEDLRTRTADERRAIRGLQPGRAEVILAGAVIVRTIVTSLGHDEFTVCDRGLRHGLLAEHLGTDVR